MPKIYSERRLESLGEELRQRRVLLEISIEEISEKTGIPTKYARRLERNDWGNLPGDVYTKGMLRRYAKAVGENPEKIVSLYEKENAESNKPKIEKTKKDNFYQNLSPKKFRNIAGAVVIAALLGYIAWQLSPVLKSPDLVVAEPEDEETIVFEDSVVLKGYTEPGASLFLNNESVSVSPEGNFERTVELLPGLNVLEVRSESRFGKESLVERKVIFQEQ